MKGKFRLLGHIGLALLVVCALMLALVPAAPASAATSVSNVWVEFPYTNAINAVSSTANVYLIHFKNGNTALSRGVDSVTVTFPDSFTVGAVAASDVSFGTSASSQPTVATATPTVGGKRVQVKTPINIAALGDVWVKFTSNGHITAANTEASTYTVSVATSKDTAPQPSTAFALGDSIASASTATLSSATAGAATQYIFALTTSETGALTASESTVSVMFPIGTTFAGSITGNVWFSSDNATYYVSPSATLDTNTRQVTATTSVSITAGAACYMKILYDAGITNPTTAADTYKAMVRTSRDSEWFLGTAYAVEAGTATKIIVANGEIGTPADRYSDNASMINMYSSQIWVTIADTNGNAKGATVTVNLTTSPLGAGKFYTNAEPDGSGAWTEVTTLSVTQADPDIAAQIVYYKGTSAGTHTLTFADAATTSPKASTTWSFTVAPAVSLYDSSNTPINTYGPPLATPTAETGDNTPSVQKYASDYINDAIAAAMPGDTVKLGDATSVTYVYEVDNDSYINLNKAITLTSANSAALSIIRNTQEVAKVIDVTTDGSATTPVIIDGLTFQRLRSTINIRIAIRNIGKNYVTVRNCVFNNIEPNADTCSQGVIWFANGTNITSATVSNNTFNSCVTTWPNMGSEYSYSGSIVFSVGHSATGTFRGVTISDNKLYNCGQYGIAIGGVATGDKHAATISNNTIDNGQLAICLASYIDSVTVTLNNITNAYGYGVYVEGTNNVTVKIKNNTITGCAGQYSFDSASHGSAVVIEKATATSTVQYNDIYNTASGYYAIKVDAGYTVGSITYGQDCKYNWYGSASGPAYTSGTTVTKLNPNGTGDKITDNVIYYPWLHVSKATVVADKASYQAATMKLVAGWNTLSTPVKLISGASTILELIPSGYTSGFYYDSGWQPIVPATKVLNPCDAVYVKMSAEKYVLLKFEASVFSSPSKSLALGWNLIGLAYLSSSGMDADDAVASVAKTAAGLPGYSQVVSPSVNFTQTDMYGNPGTSWAVSYGQANVSDKMYAGLGYWIYMQNPDVTLAGFEMTPIAPDLN